LEPPSAPSVPRVLALDDEPAIRALLSEALAAEGYTVLTAGTIGEFWDIHEGFEPHVVIVDLSLPDGIGFSVVKRLRQNSNTGIIILSGRGSETDHVLGLELGADDYVTKPFRRRELAARVGAVLRRLDDQAPTQRDTATKAIITAIDYTFDGYKVSVGSRQVWNGEGQEIVLTTAEFELLVALLRRRGQVLNRDQIMNAVKGRDWESYDRAVDGMISRLRRKLPAEGRKAHYIRTVHGIGYSFSA